MSTQTTHTFSNGRKRCRETRRLDLKSHLSSVCERNPSNITMVCVCVGGDHRQQRFRRSKLLKVVASEWKGRGRCFVAGNAAKEKARESGGAAIVTH